MTFSRLREHSSPIFKRLNNIKLPDLVFLNIAVFIYNFTIRVYHLFLILSSHKSIKDYARSASNMCNTLPKVRTNYGIFDMRFKGPKVWNSISENLKTFSISNFKESVKGDLVKDY